MKLENAFDKNYNIVGCNKDKDKKEEQKIQEEQQIQEQKPYINKKQSVKENIEREKRVVFVGNIAIEMQKKQIIKYFRQYGKIEKIWMRSIPVDNAIKLPKKAKVIKSYTVNHCKNKNCYLLYEKEEDAKRCIQEANNNILENRHIHVTHGNNIETDYKTTVFIGNLPYDIDEEELREYLSNRCGEIEYVRLIRDKLTYKGKGIGYVKFVKKEGQEKCLKLEEKYKDRELRIQKAKKNKLQKKKNGKEEEREKQQNYRQRISIKELKEREEEVKKLAKANLKNDQILDEQKMEQIYQQKGVIPQNQIKKKIRKMRKKEGLTQYQQVQLADKIKKKANEKFKKEVFENEDLLRKRREQIKKKKQMYKRLHKQQQKEIRKNKQIDN